MIFDYLRIKKYIFILISYVHLNILILVRNPFVYINTQIYEILFVKQLFYLSWLKHKILGRDQIQAQ